MVSNNLTKNHWNRWWSCQILIQNVLIWHGITQSLQGRAYKAKARGRKAKAKAKARGRKAKAKAKARGRKAKAKAKAKIFGLKAGLRPRPRPRPNIPLNIQYPHGSRWTCADHGSDVGDAPVRLSAPSHAYPLHRGVEPPDLVNNGVDVLGAHAGKLSAVIFDAEIKIKK